MKKKENRKKMNKKNQANEIRKNKEWMKNFLKSQKEKKDQRDP